MNELRWLRCAGALDAKQRDLQGELPAVVLLWPPLHRAAPCCAGTAGGAAEPRDRAAGGAGSCAGGCSGSSGTARRPGSDAGGHAGGARSRRRSAHGAGRPPGCRAGALPPPVPASYSCSPKPTSPRCDLLPSSCAQCRPRAGSWPATWLPRRSLIPTRFSIRSSERYLRRLYTSDFCGAAQAACMKVAGRLAAQQGPTLGH